MADDRIAQLRQAAEAWQEKEEAYTSELAKLEKIRHIPDIIVAMADGSVTLSRRLQSWRRSLPHFWWTRRKGKAFPLIGRHSRKNEQHHSVRSLSEVLSPSFFCLDLSPSP